MRKSWMVGHFWHQWIQYVVVHKLEFCEASAIERVCQSATIGVASNQTRSQRHTTG